MTNEVSTKKNKRKKIMKVLAALMGVFLLIGCCSIGGLTFLGSDESVPVPTKAPVVEEVVVEPTSFPTPEHLTVAAIERAREPLTDMQKEQYDQSLLGEVIKFHGRVIEVYDDGRVQINEGSLFTVVILYGIPKDVVMTWNKDHLVEGMGTVADVSTFLGVHIEVQVTSWSD